jgi:FkbM family methyltransferase
MKILKNGIAVCDDDAWISKWVEETGRLDHDQNLLPVILPYIPRDGFVVDAGAFIGDHTIAYLKAVGPEGMVTAFEPNKEAYDCLVRNCRAAACFNVALGDKLGTGKICRNANRGASHIEEGDEVKIFPLDYFRIGQLDFFKIDVEGMELKVLRGASETIQECKPVICMEINQAALQRNETNAEEVVAFVEALGYDRKLIYPDDTLSAPQLDLLFIPRGKK